MTSPIEGKIVPFGQVVDQLHAYLHDPAGEIETEAGPLPNLRKLTQEIRDAADAVDVDMVDIFEGAME